MHFKSIRRFLFTLSFFTFLFSNQLEAQTPIVNPATDTLVVAIAGSEPFIIKTDIPNDPKGIAIEIWENIASKEKWSYRYKSFATVSEALKALDDGSVNLVAGPISITSSRVEKIGFTQPYYQSSLSIVSRVDEPNLWQKIKPFFSFKLLIAVLIFLLILASVGTLLWLAERKASPDQFPDKPLKGIGNGMWLAVVTMSTVGYGDMAPITMKGRIITGTWIIVSIIFATSMVAGIASTLTLSSLGSNTVTNIEQLSNKKVATIQGSPAEAFLKEHNVEEVPVADMKEGITRLKEHEVRAVIYDRPQLRYFLKNYADEGLYLAKAEYYKQGYGFAFPLKSPLIHEVNRTLLSLAEDHSTERIIDFYLGSAEVKIISLFREAFPKTLGIRFFDSHPMKCYPILFAQAQIDKAILWR